MLAGFAIGIVPALSAGVFPGKTWDVADPAKAGWNEEKLAEARATATAIDSAAVMVIQGGKVIASWGDVDRRINPRSVRKSFLSALYGIHAITGMIDLNETVGSLGIDDTAPQLTAQEKSARVVDLLMARSGIYHLANYETETARNLRPARGSHAPGTFFYYNNWDFNALGTIFQQKTGLTVFQAFQQNIAQSIGMEDFRLEDGRFQPGEASVHPAYLFFMTARDMARFGLLYLNKGQWAGRQVVPESWVLKSTEPMSPSAPGVGYGYMWRGAYEDKLFGAKVGKGAFHAQGRGGNIILVAPALDLVVVHLGDADAHRLVPLTKFGSLLEKIVAAMPQSKNQEHP